MHIAAVGWTYVILMMAITEDSAVAGIMTFLFYGVLPVSLILYFTSSGNRRRRREQEQAKNHAEKISTDNSTSTTTGSADPNQ